MQYESRRMFIFISRGIIEISLTFKILLVRMILFQDVLMKMPGINSKNYKLILNKVEDIGGLCLMSEETLAEILGNAANAKKLWTFLHSDHKKTQETAAPTKPAKYGPYKGFKRKK